MHTHTLTYTHSYTYTYTHTLTHTSKQALHQVTESTLDHMHHPLVLQLCLRHQTALLSPHHHDSQAEPYRRPLPQANFMPTGGVAIDNVDKWLEAGAVALGTGSNLTVGAKTGDYELITKTAKEFVDAVRSCKK